MKKMRLQDGSTIVEVIDDVESDRVLLTVSKFAYAEDAMQVPLSRSAAAALGALLAGAAST